MILKQGKLPQTPHTEYYAAPDVLSLEEIHGSYGFSGPHSRKMHIRSYPTEQSKPPKKADFNFLLKIAPDDLLQPYHIFTSDIPYEGDPLTGRKPLLFGNSVIVSVSKPTKSMVENMFFRNGEKYEIYYVQDGSGTLKTEYGNIPFRKGLYIIIPKGTTYQIEIKSQNAYFLIIESNYPVTFPPHYMNNAGQAYLMAPVVETEIEPPVFQTPMDKKGDFYINTKHSNGLLTTLTWSHHPFDVVGWEGSFYPFGFHISNHHGIAREIHTAPPVHQTFQSGNVPHNGFSLCSFITQMEGWHPKEIPAPYAHSNVDSDEVMFFSSADYGARESIIKEGSITFHPGSIPHSPHGDAALKSTHDRGKISKRCAVMLDTYFESLSVTDVAYNFRDKNYATSWFNAANKTKTTV